MAESRPITFGHSPDADDAFMFYGFASGNVTIPGRQIEHIMDDIESLNRRAVAGDLDVTAISAAQYPNVARHYRIMSCGASAGRNYGPVLVARTPINVSDLSGLTVGVPGEFTTSWMLFRMFVQIPVKPVFLHFEEVERAVTEGKVDAGILLHEGQIMYKNLGLHSILDLGMQWFKITGLPIPLGLDVVHRRLGATAQLVANGLRQSVEFARSHEDEALDYALSFGRGIGREDGRRFVRMYVNDDTVDMGPDGKSALVKLYSMATELRLIKECPPLDILQVH